MIELEDGAIEKLVKMHITHDEVVIKRFMDILDRCSDRPHTIIELAEIYELHYQTMYRDVRSLRQLGLLQPTLKRGRGGADLYVTNWSALKSGGELLFKNRFGEWKPLSFWINSFLSAGETAHEQITVSGYALVSVWMNKFLKSKGENNYGLTHELACKEQIKETIGFFRGIADLLEQVADSPFWGEEEGHNMFALPADIDINKASEMHDTFEAWRQGKMEKEE